MARVHFQSDALARIRVTSAPDSCGERGCRQTRSRECSPSERHAEHRAVKVDVLELLVGLEVVVEVAPHGENAAPIPGITEPTGKLPRQLRFAGADVGVIRHIPAALVAERVATLDPNDAVPD